MLPGWRLVPGTDNATIAEQHLPRPTVKLRLAHRRCPFRTWIPLSWTASASFVWPFATSAPVLKEARIWTCEQHHHQHLAYAKVGIKEYPLVIPCRN